MTTDTINLLNLIGAVAGFLVPSYEVIVNKKRQGLKRISKVGWALFGTALYILAVGICNYYVTKANNERMDAIHKAERSADSANLVATINRALVKDSLQFDPQTGTVNNIDNRTIGIEVTGVDNTISNSRVEFQENKLSEKQTQFYYMITSFAAVKGIKDKGVYLFSVENTRGAQFFPEITRALAIYGFHVIGQGISVYNPKYSTDTLWFTTHMSKIAINVGNRFDLH